MKRLGLVLLSAWSALACGVLLASVIGFLTAPPHIYACLPPRDYQMLYLWAGVVLAGSLVLAGAVVFYIAKLRE